MRDPIVDLGLSCPSSSRFYICEDQATRFVGCCTINPCTTADGLCPDDDLQPASFSPDAYAKILAQDCLDPGFLWYTCRDSSPPFLGCCSQSACGSSGCPRDSVGAASLSGNKQQAAPFLSSGSSSTSSATSRASSTTLSTAASTTASTTASATGTQPAVVSPPAHTGLSKGAIGGIAVGAVAGGCILTLVAFWALRQRKKKKSPSTIAAASSGSGSGRKDEYGEDSLTEYQDGSAHTHALPGAGAGQMAQSLHAQPSPGLESSISELPATPGNPHIISMASSDGVTGRESELSGLSASTQQSRQPKQPSPLIHQSLFELEDSSSRTFVGR